MIDNLPDWGGAAVVYSRVMEINATKAKEEYKNFCMSKEGKSLKRPWEKFRVSDEIREAIDALNSGDEEFLKWYVMANRKYLTSL